MNAQRNCSRCGTTLDGYAPQGLCAGCLLQVDFQTEVTAAGGPTSPPISAGDNSSAPSCATSGLSSIATALRTFGDYDLLEEIARGGMGIVYKARQRSLNRTVAVKMILSGAFSTKEYIQRFRSEAAAAAMLQHPNIVAIHEIGMTEGQHFFSMDYVSGPSLAELARGEPLPPRQAARYVQIIAEAIHYAHQQGVLHRDLKPSNVLIDSATDQPRVTDFGLAKRLTSNSQLSTHDSQLTLTGQVLGSPNYMPPEQASAERGRLGRPSDVYSLGAILYHLLTGRPPFQGNALEDILLQVLKSDALSPRALNRGVPADIETVCLKCLEKEPEKRYPTAQALADELARYLRDEPIHARPVTHSERAWRWCRRNPVSASLGGVAALLLLVTATVSLMAAKRERANALVSAQRLKETRRLLYASDMKVVEQAWESGDTRLALRHLTDQIPQGVQEDLRGFEWRYFWKLCQGEQSFILQRQFTNGVSGLAISPDGKTLVLAEGPLYVFDLPSRKELYALTNHGGGALAVAFSPSGDFLLSSGHDDMIRFWNVAQWHEQTAVPGRSETTAKFPPSGKVSGLGIVEVAFASDGQRFTTLGFDGGLKIWDVATRRASPLEFGEFIGGACFVLNGRGLFLGTARSLQLFDTQTRTATVLLKREPFGDEFIVSSRDGRVVAIAGGDEIVRLYDCEAQKLFILPTERPKMSGRVALSATGDLLAVGSIDSTIELWSTKTLRRLGVLRGHTGPITCIGFNSDGTELVSASQDNSVRVWNLSAPGLQNVLAAHAQRIWSIALSPDEQTLASGSWDGNISLWDTQAWTNNRTLGPISNHALCVAFSPDGETLAAADGNFGAPEKPGHIRIWNLRSYENIGTLSGHEAVVYFVAFSPDGKWLASTGGPDETARVWDTATWQLRAVLPGHKSYANQLAFSPDGKLLAVSSGDREIKLWDVATFKSRGRLPGHSGGSPLGLWFSRDSRLLVSSGWDTKVKLWDVASQTELASLEGHKARVKTVVFSPDDKTVASGSHDGTIKLWSVAARREVATLNSSTPSVNSVVFSRDGKTLYAGCADGTIRRWRAPSLEEIAELKKANAESLGKEK